MRLPTNGRAPGDRSGAAPHRTGSSTKEGRGGRPPIEDIDDLIALGRMWKGGPFGGPGWGPHRRGPRSRTSRRRSPRDPAAAGRGAAQRLSADPGDRGAQRRVCWRPSPGSVYPTLSQLKDEGLIRSVDTEGTRLFELTDAGREHLEGRAEEPDPWEPAGRGGGEPAGRARAAGHRGSARPPSRSPRSEMSAQRRPGALATDRHPPGALYRILAEDAEGPDADDDERDM